MNTSNRRGSPRRLPATPQWPRGDLPRLTSACGEPRGDALENLPTPPSGKSPQRKKARATADELLRLQLDNAGRQSPSAAMQGKILCKRYGIPVPGASEAKVQSSASTPSLPSTAQPKSPLFSDVAATMLELPSFMSSHNRLGNTNILCVSEDTCMLMSRSVLRSAKSGDLDLRRREEMWSGLSALLGDSPVNKADFSVEDFSMAPSLMARTLRTMKTAEDLGGGRRGDLRGEPLGRSRAQGRLHAPRDSDASVPEEEKDWMSHILGNVPASGPDDEFPPASAAGKRRTSTVEFDDPRDGQDEGDKGASSVSTRTDRPGTATTPLSLSLVGMRRWSSKRRASADLGVRRASESPSSVGRIRRLSSLIEPGSPSGSAATPAEHPDLDAVFGYSVLPMASTRAKRKVRRMSQIHQTSSGDIRAVAAADASQSPANKRGSLHGAFMKGAGLLAMQAVGKLKQGSRTELDEVEVARVRTAFNRFRAPGETEIDKDKLMDVMRHLGYNQVGRDVVDFAAKEISAYGTLDLGELCRLVEKVDRVELTRLQKLFDEFDEEQDGELSDEKLRLFMLSVGFTPLREVLTETIAIIDEDESGTFSFDEIVHLMELFKCTEGFRQQEISILRALYTEATESLPESDLRPSAFRGVKLQDMPRLPVRLLPDILISHFGSHLAQIVWHFAKQAENANAADADDKDAESDSHGQQLLTFTELLLWARHVREAMYSEWLSLFQACDVEGSGRIPKGELKGIARGMGYACSAATLREVWEDAHADSDEADFEAVEDMDFDDLVKFMMVLHPREGFSLAELEEVEDNFRRFCGADKKLGAFEFCDLIRHTGRYIDLAEAQEELQEFNYAGKLTRVEFRLDFAGFLRIMRKRREAELLELRTAYDRKVRRRAGLSAGSIVEVLESLGYSLSDPGVPSQEDDERADSKSSMLSLLPPPDIKALLEFEDLVRGADDARCMRTLYVRRMAGFTPEEFEVIRAFFSAYDSDRSGGIDVNELSSLLMDYGIALLRKDDQKSLMDDISMARDAASAAVKGSKPASRASTGHGRRAAASDISIWVLAQLLRLLKRRAEMGCLEREKEAVAKTRFRPDEVEQFRQVFQDAVRSSSMDDDWLTGGSPSKLARCKAVKSLIEPTKDVTSDGVMKLLRIGAKTAPPDQVQLLRQRILQFSSWGQPSPSGTGTKVAMVDFAGFLRLMRWMLDSNFAGVRGPDAQPDSRSSKRGTSKSKPSK